MKIVDQVEALLFAGDSPAPVAALAAAIGATEGQVEQALEILERRLEEQGGLRLAKLAGGYQLCTKAEHAEIVANYLKPQRNRLSRSLMEVLAIVAYQQPVTVLDVERIRGVQSEYSVKALQERRLIEEKGRKHAPGRPVLFGTTDQFLHQFGLEDLSALPQIERAPDPESAVAIELYTPTS